MSANFSRSPPPQNWRASIRQPAAYTKCYLYFPVPKTSHTSFWVTPCECLHPLFDGWILWPRIPLLTQTTISARDSYVPLHSSESLFQFLALSVMNMMLAQSTGQSINILPKTGPTGGNSTLSATRFIPLVRVISSTLPWGWCGNETTNIIKHFVKLCMEAEGNHSSSAQWRQWLLPLNRRSNLQTDDNCIGAWSYGFIERNASTIPSKMQQTCPLTCNYFLIFWNWLEMSLKSYNIAFTEKLQAAQHRTLK